LSRGQPGREPTPKQAAEKACRAGKYQKRVPIRRRPGSSGQQFLYVLEAMLAIPLGSLVSRMPWKLARAFGRLAGHLMFCLDQRDKRQAFFNLELMYTDDPLADEEKHRIVKQLFMNIAQGAVEFFKIADLRADNYHEFIQLGDYTPLLHALGEGRGVLAITAHLGNWEYLGSVVAKLGLNVGAVINRQHNPYTDRWLSDFREQKGKVKCIYEDASAMAHVEMHLRQNGILALLADQRELGRPVFVPFFGRICPTHDGPARLHLWYEAPMVFCSSVRMENGKYLFSVDGPYHFENSGDVAGDCREIMSWVNRKYEELLRRYPDQWFSLMTPRWGYPGE